MARITVEDCLQHVKNRFELVIVAAKRARKLMRGTVDPIVPWENDKATVVALREIATGNSLTEAPESESTSPTVSSELISPIHEEIDLEFSMDEKENSSENDSNLFQNTNDSFESNIEEETSASASNEASNPDQADKETE